MIYGNPVMLCEKMYVTPQKEIRKQTRDADTGEENCLQYLDGNAYITVLTHKCLMHSYRQQFLSVALKSSLHTKK